MNDDSGPPPPGYQQPPPQPTYYQQAPPPQVGAPTPQPQSTKSSGTGSRIAYILVMLAFAAASVALFMYFFSQREKGSQLQEEGIETTADVGNVSTLTRNGSVVSNDVELSFQPEGATAPVTVEATDCSADRWNAGRSTVDVVYMPDDPEVVELAGCTDSSGPLFPAILGGAFAVVSLLMLRNMFRRT